MQPPDTTPVEAPQKAPGILSRIGSDLGQGVKGALFRDTSTPAGKIGAEIGGVLGKLGQGEALAQGSDAVRQGVLQQQEIQGKLPLEIAQLKALETYRQAQVGIGQQKATTGQQKADTGAMAAKVAADAKMQDRYMLPDADGSGAYHAASPDEILANPKLLQNQEVAQAAINAKQTASQLAQARQQALTNPNSLTQQNFLKSLEEKDRIAQGYLHMATVRAGQANERMNMEGQRDMFNFGQNTQTGAQLGPQNAPPGMLTMPNGQPVPYRNVSAFSPTQQIKNVSAQAKIAADGIPGVVAEVNDLRDSLGPVMGRWNEFTQGKIGMNNPAFSGLNTDLVMVSSAVALAHARGRLPENLREEFDNMMHAPQQSPENVIAVLQHVKPWMDRMAAEASQNISAPPVTPRKGGTTTPNSVTPPSAGSPPSFSDWKKSQTGGR